MLLMCSKEFNEKLNKEWFYNLILVYIESMEVYGQLNRLQV